MPKKIDWSGVDAAKAKERETNRNRSREIRAHVQDAYGIEMKTPKDFDLTKKEQRAAERQHKRDRPSDFSGRAASGVKSYGTEGAKRGGIK